MVWLPPLGVCPDLVLRVFDDDSLIAVGSDHAYNLSEFVGTASLGIRGAQPQMPLGCKWRVLGTTAPPTGTPVATGDLAALSNCLKLRLEFSPTEWDGFGVTDLGVDSYIEAGGVYYRPARSALSNGGAGGVTQWVPLRESALEGGGGSVLVRVELLPHMHVTDNGEDAPPEALLTKWDTVPDLHPETLNCRLHVTPIGLRGVRVPRQLTSMRTLNSTATRPFVEFQGAAAMLQTQLRSQRISDALPPCCDALLLGLL
jgi:hypothetical protein